MAWLSGSILKTFPCILNASLFLILGTMTTVKAKFVVNRCEARYVKAGLCRQTCEGDCKMSCANAKSPPKSCDQVCEDGTTPANQPQRVPLVITYNPSLTNKSTFCLHLPVALTFSKINSSLPSDGLKTLV